MTSVLPKLRFQTNNYIPESINDLESELRELIRYAISGIAPMQDIMFNLGMNWESDEWYFVFPFMLRAYETGLKVMPYINECDLGHLLWKYNNGYNDAMHKWGDSYEDYLKADVCVLCLDSSNVEPIRVLANIRRLKGKATSSFIKRIKHTCRWF